MTQHLLIDTTHLDFEDFFSQDAPATLYFQNPLHSLSTRKGHIKTEKRNDFYIFFTQKIQLNCLDMVAGIVYFLNKDELIKCRYQNMPIYPQGNDLSLKFFMTSRPEKNEIMMLHNIICEQKKLYSLIQESGLKNRVKI